MPAQSWRLASTELDLTRGILMGVVNVTPDSFTDGGQFLDPDRAVVHGLKLIADGAAIVDVGGESTRPGAEPVPEEDELARVMPVVEGLVAEGAVVSIDTYKPAVAAAALQAGAELVNDVTGCRSEEMVQLVADSGCGVVVMHMQGTPRDMAVNPTYHDVVAEVEDYLLTAARRLAANGVDPARVALDPGIGFGKRPHHSLALLASVTRLAGHGHPLVLGTSRKGFLSQYADGDRPKERDLATAVSTALGFNEGARVFRVHNVTSSRRALALAYDILEHRKRG